MIGHEEVAKVYELLKEKKEIDKYDIMAAFNILLTARGMEKANMLMKMVAKIYSDVEIIDRGRKGLLLTLK